MKTLKQTYQEAREQAITLLELDNCLLKLENECGYADLMIPESEAAANE